MVKRQKTPNTKYYVRAYASNEAGVGYGNQVEFTTLLNNFINNSNTFDSLIQLNTDKLVKILDDDLTIIHMKHIYTNKKMYILSLKYNDNIGFEMSTIFELSISDIIKYINAKKRQIDLLTEQKQAIIHQAVTRGLDPSVPMKDSGIEWLGDIPEHWEITPIKRVLKRLIDTEHKTAPAFDGGKYPVIRTSNIKDCKLVFDDIYYTNEEGYLEWTKRGKPLPGDILFTREAPAGEACIVPEGIDLCMGQRVVLLGVDSLKISSNFLLLMLYSGLPGEYIKIKSVGSTVPHLNMSDIINLPIIVSPLCEQDQIVTQINKKIKEIENIVDKIMSEIDLIQEYRTRLITDIVTGKLDVRSIAPTFPDIEDTPLDEPGEEEPDEDLPED